jgi:hypothetical protein
MHARFSSQPCSAHCSCFTSSTHVAILRNAHKLWRHLRTCMCTKRWYKHCLLCFCCYTHLPWLIYNVGSSFGVMDFTEEMAQYRNSKRSELVTLPLHCRYTVVTLLLYCCNTAVTLLLHFCYTFATLPCLSAHHHLTPQQQQRDLQTLLTLSHFYDMSTPVCYHVMMWDSFLRFSATEARGLSHNQPGWSCTVFLPYSRFRLLYSIVYYCYHSVLL